MRELSKSIPRRLRDPNFVRRYFVGDGFDIGGAPDPLHLYAEFFPLMRQVRIWDLEDGDAQYMEGIPDESIDFVHASHCLEHLRDPVEGLVNWFRILRPGGFLVITIPDEDLYEQGVFPSTFNRDHKHTFTIYKQSSWSTCSINVLSLFDELGPQARPEKIELLDATYRFGLPRYDQTSTPVGECAIEFIVRKADAAEARRGARVRTVDQPAPEQRRYYNQYRDDYAAMKRWNAGQPPFENEDPL
jgi:SAM-dependent methyltransferase